MTYSLLLTNGRIIDPLNGIDMIGDIGLNDGRIIEVGKELSPGKAEKHIDLTDKWVIPGIIDPHVHVSPWLGDYPGLKMMAKEGIITAVDLAGPPSGVIENIRDYGSGMNIACVDAFYRDISGGKRIDFSDNEIRERIYNSIRNGAIGIKLLGGHYPLTTEMTGKVIRFAAKEGLYVACHAGTTSHGSNIDGLKEIVELSAGYPIHIAHVNSYCRGYIREPLAELNEALDLLYKAPNVWSESYLSVFNGTSAKCINGQIISDVTKRSCHIGGFSSDQKGLGEAIKAGFGNVVGLKGGENVLINGDEGYRIWSENNTDVAISFPVNLPEIQFGFATMKGRDGKFIVDALCTDGGGIPRNTSVQQGLNLVHSGALSVSDFVNKVSGNAAAMLGLIEKGHLSPGADSDVTVMDPAKGKAYMGIASGKIIMVDGIVVGNGGTFITTKEGEPLVKESGVNYMVVDTSNALKYKIGKKI